MAKGVPEGKTFLGFNAPIEMAEALDDIALKRWGKTDRTALLLEAVTEFLDRELNPDFIDNQILQALERKPDLLEDHVRRIIEKFAARQLSK